MSAERRNPGEGCGCAICKLPALDPPFVLGALRQAAYEVKRTAWTEVMGINRKPHVRAPGQGN